MIAETFTDDRLLTWARDLGADLTDRDQLLDAAAVGLTLLAWRNTVLEDIHAGAEHDQGLDAGYRDPSDGASSEQLQAEADQARAAHHDRLSAHLGGLTGAADRAEAPRVAALLAGRRAGHGIPDDVMFRINVSTVLDVRRVLAAELEPAMTVLAADVRYDPADVPDYLGAVYDELTEPDRGLWFGACATTVEELLGQRRWQIYCADVDRKTAGPLRFSDLLGARRGLWLVALSGLSHCPDWFPNPHWPAAVTALRAAVAEGRWTDAVWSPERVAEHPDPTDEVFWRALATDPSRLSGRQAKWVISSRLRDIQGAVREEARQRLGALPDTERFNPFMAMF